MSPEYSINETTTVVNPARLDAVRGSETLVVCGAARGMTSVVSYTLHEMKYFLGDDIGAQNYEDNDVLACLPFTKRMHHGTLPGSFPSFNALIAKRNATHQRWGFKLPHAAYYVPLLRRRLRNPVFVVCVRNPLATIASIHRREARVGMPFPKMFDRSIDYFAGIRPLLGQAQIPVILVNMDAVQRRPGRFLNEFSALLDIKGNKHKIREQISTRGYSARHDEDVTDTSPAPEDGAP